MDCCREQLQESKKYKKNQRHLPSPLRDTNAHIRAKRGPSPPTCPNNNTCLKKRNRNSTVVFAISDCFYSFLPCSSSGKLAPHSVLGGPRRETARRLAPATSHWTRQRPERWRILLSAEHPLEWLPTAISLVLATAGGRHHSAKTCARLFPQMCGPPSDLFRTARSITAPTPYRRRTGDVEASAAIDAVASGWTSRTREHRPPVFAGRPVPGTGCRRDAQCQRDAQCVRRTVRGATKPRAALEAQ